ncbi:MAG: lytic transglycosylase domain-containing protein [Candidatus Nanopelagicales bacterium]
MPMRTHGTSRRLGIAATVIGAGAVVVAITACEPPMLALSVPDSYKSYFQVAAKRCPGVLTPEGLAAQASAESGFDPGAVSPAGAQGLMQIIPEVWSVYGTDADGDGQADPFTAADSVATSAKFNCYLAQELRSMGGDQTELRLAAYNAGLGAVQKYDGIPPYPETEEYVKRVAQRTEAFVDDFANNSAKPRT